MELVILFGQNSLENQADIQNLPFSVQFNSPWLIKISFLLTILDGLQNQQTKMKEMITGFDEIWTSHGRRVAGAISWYCTLL